jgi:tripartite-type tricarboxylate transporter receptor subunit TctC
VCRAASGVNNRHDCAANCGEGQVRDTGRKLPKLEDVFFKGGGDALQALLSGTAQLSSGSLPPAAPHIKASTLRCLAVTGETLA